LEATFFGVMLLGRDRAPPWFYFLSCCMVSIGTMLSSFWILCNNSWMQVPLGHVIVDGKFVPVDWWSIVSGPIVRVRWPHMLLAAFLTTGMSIIATGAWYLLRGRQLAEARVMLHWGIGLVAAIIPVQMFFGHVTGLYAAFVQGAAVGAMMRGIPVVDGQYAGGRFEWLAPLPVVTGIGLVLGYALLGAGWLVLKSEGALREWAWQRVPRLAAAVLVVLAVAAAASIVQRDRVIDQVFLGRTWGFVFPAIGLLAIYGVFAGARRRRDGWPFAMTVLFFLASFASLAVLFWPYMIPYSVTVGRRLRPMRRFRSCSGARAFSCCP
jgi:Cytochrome bd terminal oxidase subunit I/Cytochrome bd terminal oxidase subunit II